MSTNYRELEEKRKKLVNMGGSELVKILDHLDNAFDIDFTSDSTQIEGNNLTKRFTSKMIGVLKDTGAEAEAERVKGLIASINAYKSMVTPAAFSQIIKSFFRNDTALHAENLPYIMGEMKPGLTPRLSRNETQILEQINHHFAVCYVRHCVQTGKKINHDLVKDHNQILLDGIRQGGIPRRGDVYISGTDYIPPSANTAFYEMKDLVDGVYSHPGSPFDGAANIKGEFARIHPFDDGNGRGGRLLMNQYLMEQGWLPISIKSADKNGYFDALEAWHGGGRIKDADPKPLTHMIERLEGERLDRAIKAVKEYRGPTK